MNKEKQREENRQKVIQASLKCFKEKSIEKTALKEIAEEANLSLRSLHRYFIDKNDLIIQSISEYMKPSYESLLLYIQSSDFQNLSGLEQCAAYFRKIFMVLNDDPNLVILGTEYQLYLWHTRSPLESTTAAIKKLLTQILTKGINDGTIRPDINVDLILETMIRKFKGFIQSVASFTGEDAVFDELSTQCFEQGLEIFIFYLKK